MYTISTLINTKLKNWRAVSRKLDRDQYKTRDDGYILLLRKRATVYYKHCSTFFTHNYFIYSVEIVIVKELNLNLSTAAFLIDKDMYL
jgi:hypothetical protein